MDKPNSLVMLWTSADRDVALKMVFMYTLNSKLRGWWEDVILVVWGPSTKLLSVDLELQDYMRRMIKSGVTVKACKACTDEYGVTTDLERLGIDVKYMGEPLTQYLKGGQTVLTI